MQDAAWCSTVETLRAPFSVLIAWPPSARRIYRLLLDHDAELERPAPKPKREPRPKAAPWGKRRSGSNAMRRPTGVTADDLLQAVRRGGPVGTLTLSREFNVSAATTYRRLKQLRQLGQVEQLAHAWQAVG